MYKHDSQFEWRIKRLWIDSQAFTCYITAAGVGNGVPVFTQIASSDLTAIEMEANDLVNVLVPIPYDMDLKKHIYFRLLWSVGSGADITDTVDWALLYTTLTAGTPDGDATTTPSTTTVVIPATALDTTLSVASGGAQQVGSDTEDRMLWTGYGSINPYSLDGSTVRGLNPLNDFLHISMGSGTMGGSMTGVHLHGLEISYTRRLLDGPDGMNHPATRYRQIAARNEVVSEVVR